MRTKEKTNSRVRTEWQQPGFWQRQKAILRHRSWLLALIVLYQLFLYPIGTAMVITAQDRDVMMQFTGDSSAASAAVVRAYRQSAVSSFLGLRGGFWWVPLLVGAIAGIYEFAWLFSMVKMDYYESQPVSRRQRFRDLWCNGALLFIIPQWVMGLLGLVTAAGMDAMSADILLDGILALVVNTVNFLAAYSVTILACTLCGNGIVAACLAGFFLLAEPLWKSLYLLMAGSYFITYNGVIGASRFYFTPVMNAVAIPNRISWYYGSSMSTFPAGSAAYVLGQLAPYVAANVIIGIVAVLLARWAFIRRKAESAGGSVLYLPVREAAKILIAGTAAVIAGYLVDTVVATSTFEKPSGGDGFLIVLIMVLVGMIAAGVMQCIYEFSFRAFFHDWWSMVFAILLGGIVLATFLFDLTGFNRYLPERDRIASGALSFYQNQGRYYERSWDADVNVSQDTYLAENMELTGGQIDSLLKIAAQGQAYLVESAEDTQGRSWSGFSATVTWRLTNGRKVSRNLYIPYDVDEAAMNDILSSDAYKDVVYQVSGTTAADRYAEKGKLLYSDGLLQTEGSGALFSQFKEAYEKDLEQYDYTLASKEFPVGYVELVYTPQDNDADYRYVQSSYEVYPEYSHTLDFLEKNGMALAPAAEEVSRIGSVSVTNYGIPEQSSRTYTDKEEIRTILAAGINTDMAPAWYPLDDAVDYNYGYFVEMDPSVDQGERSEDFGGGGYLRKGEVPAQIEKDLGSAD